MTDCILSLDLGTSSVRSILFDLKGNILHLSKFILTQSYPKPSWVEEDPLLIWEGAKTTLKNAAAFAKEHKYKILCMGITNQRETTIVWDKKTSTPIYPAIVWQDRRTAKECADLKAAGLEKQVQSLTGLLIDPYFSATKLAWILKHVPLASSLSSKDELAFGTVDSFILWKLTDGAIHGTDVTNASRTMLFNIHTLGWDDELLSIFKIPRSLLPQVYPTSGFIAKITSLPELKDIPITAIAGDQHAALFGQHCFEKSSTKCTYGTGCFILMNIGEKPIISKHRLLTTIAFQVKDQIFYALEGSIFMGGALIQWLRDNLQIISSSEESEALASLCDDTDGVYFVPAFTGLGAPYWDPYAKGTLFGVTRGTSRAHIARASLEAIAFQVCDVIEAMEKDAEHKISMLKADGGASENLLLMQIQADLVQSILHIPKNQETTALGVCFLAGIGADIYTLDTVKKQSQVNISLSPKLPIESVNHKKNYWKHAVACTHQWSELNRRQDGPS